MNGELPAPVGGSESPHAAALAWADWFDGLHSARARGAARPTLVRAKHYADRRFTGPVPLDTLASQAHLSKFHFVRAFREIFRQTPHRYLIQRRIARARELLERTEMPVTAICFEVGFESLGSFSKRFKQLVGEPPGRYRRRFAIRGALDDRAIPACLYEAGAVRPHPGAAGTPRTAISEKRGSGRDATFDSQTRTGRSQE